MKGCNKRLKGCNKRMKGWNKNIKGSIRYWKFVTIDWKDEVRV